MLNDDEFLATLSDKFYLKLSHGELDGEAASNLLQLDQYKVWVNDQN